MANAVMPVAQVTLSQSVSSTELLQTTSSARVRRTVTPLSSFGKVTYDGNTPNLFLKCGGSEVSSFLSSSIQM